MDYQRFESFFVNYCQAFINLTGKPDPNLKLKKEHSLGVAEEARRLAENEKFGPRLVFLTRLAGLLHDIGRFEQYIKFKTFKDSESIDHARLGFKILSKEEIIKSLPVGDSRCVRLAVMFHSRFSVPTGLPEEISLVARALRDADKLNIFPIMISNLGPGMNNSVVTLGLDNSDGISPRILDRVSSGRLGEYSHMRHLNDFKLLICSWVYDLNYSYSHRMVLRRGYIQKVFRLLPDRPDLHCLKNRILEHLQNVTIQGV